MSLSRGPAAEGVVAPGLPRDGIDGSSSAWFVLLVVAAILGTFVHAGVLLPLELLLVGFIGLALWIGLAAPLSQANVLPRFFVLVYVLPFSILAGYLFSPDFEWMLTPRGREVVADPRLVREMATLGVVGLLGLGAGFRLAARAGIAREVRRRSGAALGLLSFAGLVAFGVFLSWMNAPPETIFQARYAVEQTESLGGRINFPAAHVVSYIVMILLALDAERERTPERRRIKIGILTFAVSYIVIVLQLLRGDRESMGLLAALAGIYLTTAPGPEGARPALRRRAKRLVIPAVVLTIVFLFIGWARVLLSGVAESVDLALAAEYWLRTATWTAVLWTVVGAVWEHQSGLLEYRLGGTYVDYLLSLPPGMMTRALGVERPLEAWRGIAWDDPAGVSAGGLHAVIVPFKNFGAVGVAAILCGFGYLIGRIEVANANGGLLARLVWSASLGSGLLWFWYGDMPFIRAMAAALLVFVIYRLGLYVTVAARNSES